MKERDFIMGEIKKIEDKMKNVLSGNKLKNALEFASFLRENELSPEWHDSGHGWDVVCNNESVGFIAVNGALTKSDSWTIWFNSCDFDESVSVDKNLKETAWKHASICGNFSSGGKDCGCGDQPGFSRMIFGKKFENRCHSPLMFENPDDKTLENVKKLILMLK